MNIIELKEKQEAVGNEKLNKMYTQFQLVLTELRKQHLPENVVNPANDAINALNTTHLSGNQLNKLIKQQQTTILKQVEKELKIVPKNYYRNMWMLFGFSGFGVPIGVAIGLSVNNIGLLGVGLPIGMAIGLAVGSSLDKKAAKEGKQLDVEIKY